MPPRTPCRRPERAFVALGKYQKERIETLSLRPWLYRITLNMVRNVWRQRRREVTVAETPERTDDWFGKISGSASGAQYNEAGQTKPTPILLRYTEGDWNALHRDLYGNLVFPLQVVIGLDAPGVDHTGGEFLLVEQRPRAQSRGTSTTLKQGCAIVFTTRDRPVKSSRGWSASPVRHGVSVVRSGVRRTLGLVFHDAK